MNAALVMSTGSPANAVTNAGPLGFDFMEASGRWGSYMALKKPKTFATYNWALSRFFTFLKSDPGRTLNRSTVKDYIVALKEEGKQPTTNKLYLSAIRQFCTFLADEGFISYEESLKIKDLKTGERVDNEYKKDYLRTPEAAALLITAQGDSLKAKRDFAIISLMLTSGMRTIEVSRALVGDIERRKNTVTGEARIVLYKQGKGHDTKDRFVELLPRTVQAIDNYLEARKSLTGKPADPKEPLFAATANRCKNRPFISMTTRSISGIVKKHLVKAGYESPRLTAHSLRHTAATIAYQEGSTLEEVQEMLDHSSSITTRKYMHMANRDNNKSQSRIENAIFEELAKMQGGSKE